MIALQVITVLFGLFMLYVVRIHRRKHHLEAFEYGAWIGVWGIFIFLSIFPQTVSGIAETLHISRVFDLLVIIAFMVLVYLTFQNYITYKKLEKKLEEIIRKRAIEKSHE
jgi:hypothetical protein